MKVRLSKWVLLTLFSVLQIALFGQRTISGTVTDATTKEPLIGASVVITGTTKGIVTDFDGKFSLDVPKEATTLTISFTGYDPQTVTIGAANVIDVQLDAGKLLNEVVVVGYGSQKKSDLTGTLTSVSEKSFNRGILNSPEQLLTGKVAGMQVTTNSGEPGTGTTIRIRGATSVRASNEPLYVIDGVPIDNTDNSGLRNPLNSINPSDIANITVLKDASAGAIYGARAANGVIMITTKKGEAGKLRFNYEGSVSVSQVAKKIETLTSSEFKDLVRQADTSLLSIFGDENTDWFDAISRTAISTSHTLGASGGKGNTTYRASVGFQNQNGILKKTSSDRLNLTLGFSQALLDKTLNITGNVKASLTGEQFSPGIGGALSMAPTQPIYDSKSKFGGFWEWTDFPIGVKNPVAEMTLQTDKGQTQRSIGNIQFDYQLPFIKGLSANLNLGYDYQTGWRKTLRPAALFSQQSSQGSMKNERFLRTSQLLEFYGKYQKELPGISSKFDAMVGYSYQDFKADFRGFNGQMLKNPNMAFSDIKELSDSASIVKEAVPFFSVIPNRLISFFGRFNYNLKERYLLTINVRQDGSSNFGPSLQRGLFPSAALAWRVTEEPFMEGVKGVLSDLKIRVGYGVIGQEKGIATFAYLKTWQPSDLFAQYQFGDRFYTTIRPSAYDPSLHWEETRTQNFGIDFGFVNNRLTGSLDIYDKKTTDLLFDVNVPAGSNLSNRVLTNIGSMSNKGVELTLEAAIIAKKDFNWNLSGNVAFNTNKILGLDGSDDPKFQGYETGGIAGGVGNNIQILKVGQQLNTFFMLQQTYENGKPLQGKFADTNGDGKFDQKDRVPNLSPAPRYFFGLTSTATYKKFDLNFTIRGNIGNYVYNNVLSNGTHFQRVTNGVAPTAIIKSPDNIYFTASTPEVLRSDFFLENGSFVRIDNVQLGYNFDIQKVGGFRAFVVVQNPALFTNYKGIDPEIQSGIDNNIYPRSRTYTLGINAKF